MDPRFLREEMLLGAAAMEALAGSHVAVVGLGGVGSWCAEALARAGLGALTLMDEDSVSPSNINRQSIALDSTLGRPKADVMAQRVRDIAPSCAVTPIVGRYEAAHRERLFSAGPFDYIVDAIDLVACKLDLICTALARTIPIVSALGTGNKLDASQLRLSDICATQGCPLARVMRKELRARGVQHLPVVFSPEQGLTPTQPETPPPGRRSIPGSLVWVPATAGMLLCQKVVLDLCGGALKTPLRKGACQP